MKFFDIKDIYGVNGENKTTTVRGFEKVNSNGFLLKLCNETLLSEGIVNFEIVTVDVNSNNILEIMMRISSENLFTEHHKTLKCNMSDIGSNRLISELIVSVGKYLNKYELDIRELIGISGTIKVEIDGKGTVVAINKMSNVKILKYNKIDLPEINDEIKSNIDLMNDCEDNPIKLDILNQFINGYVDKGHYQVKGTTFYRFSAIKKFNENITEEFFKRQIPSILKMEVLPNQIFIYENTMELTFYPRKYFYFKNKAEYLKLMLKFSDFIDSSRIEGLKVNTGSLQDSPHEVENDLEVREDIKFTKQEFGSNKIYVWGDISMDIKYEN